MNLQQMMQQAQKMQAEMKKAQDELEQSEFTATAGNGAVTVVCNGRYEFKSVKLTPEAMADKDLLEDLVLAALKDASTQISTTIEQKMSRVTSGVKIPGMPF